jgi:cytochrome P450
LELALHFDPLSPQFRRDPYPVYDQLRAHAPILFMPEWNTSFLTAYEDVNLLLRDRRLGRSIDHVLTRAERVSETETGALAPFSKLSEHSLFDKEPPDHTRLRNLVHKAFTPRRVESLRERIHSIADGLIDQVEARGHMDLLADFAVPLPVIVIAELLGVPEDDRHRLRPWSQDIVAMYELDHTEGQARRAVQAAIEFSDYLRALADQRRRAPQDDLISALVAVEDAGDQLSEDELISTCILLLNAGHEATVNVIGNGMLALLRHPDQLRRLIHDPALIASAVEEMLRYDTPLQLFKRWVLEDMRYKGHTFRQGMELAFMFGAANRDPARFKHPAEFDITRAENPHISFGGGVHYCLGAPLARLELNIALRTLLQRLPALHLGDDAPEYRDTVVIRGLERLTVGF